MKIERDTIIAAIAAAVLMFLPEKGQGVPPGSYGTGIPETKTFNGVEVVTTAVPGESLRKVLAAEPGLTDPVITPSMYYRSHGIEAVTPTKIYRRVYTTTGHKVIEMPRLAAESGQMTAEQRALLR